MLVPMSVEFRPRRSVLFLPGANAKALSMAETIPADVLVFDLEDAVAPENKEDGAENGSRCGCRSRLS